MSVKDWPKYLLRDIPPEVRAGIEDDADRDGSSLIEVVRGILCSYYELNCEPVESIARQEIRRGFHEMLLRLQPDLDLAIETDIETRLATDQLERRYGAKDKIIHEILAAHYS